MKELKLQNFRCFAEQNIDFRSGINLFIGDNASGKTSILKACKYVLSSFFSGFSDENTTWTNPDVDDFREVVTTEGLILPEQPVNIYFNIDDIIEYPLLLNGNSTHGRIEEPKSPYVLTKNSKKNSRSLIAGIKNYKDYAARLKDQYISETGQSHALPLFASFSTEDIHSKRKIDARKFKSYNVKPSFGYYECLEGDGFFEYWINRLLILQEGREGHPEISIVRNAIKEALGSNGCNIIQDIHIRPIQNKVYYIFRDGREVEANYLSDGYKRLINIVTDLAFRCALLNRGIYGEDTCSKTKGTVLIDEVDLHLHPSMQSVVLNSLRHTFPNLQFVVSSHAAMVMSVVENNEMNVVYKLAFSKDNGYTISEVDTYGMDLSTLTDTVLDQTPRAKEVADRLNELFAFIDNDQIDKAKYLLHDLRDKHKGNLPELSEAESLLNCIIG